jgi:hypothetical protein
MKSLTEFRHEPVTEEKADHSKFDALVRAGLANKAQLQRIHSILDKMQEDKPTFNNADRMILQNLFNKMVDLLTSNKQIFSQARRSVSEGVIDSSDYKVSASGKKYRAHRIVVSKDKIENGEENLKEELTKFDPPFVLVLKRKAIRLYPGSTRIALYYSDKLNKYFSVPYSTEENQSGVVQAEETIMSVLEIVRESQQSQTISYGENLEVTIDFKTADAILKVYDSLNEENKIKITEMIEKNPENLNKVASFALSKTR